MYELYNNADTYFLQMQNICDNLIKAYPERRRGIVEISTELARSAIKYEGRYALLATADLADGHQPSDLEQYRFFKRKLYQLIDKTEKGSRGFLTETGTHAVVNFKT